MAENGFDPSKHVIDLKGKQYLPVAWRIAWLRNKHPGAQLVTKVIEHSEKHAIFRAEVRIPDEKDGPGVFRGAVATGYGSETQGDFGDFLEKAETKAIGRALAALGFGTQFCDDFDEGGSVTDSPIARSAKPAAPKPRQDGPPSAGQARNELRRALAVKFVGDEQAVHEFMKAVELGAVGETTVDYSAISPERCGEIVAILQGADDSVEQPA